jgi:hypothetical protein
MWRQWKETCPAIYWHCKLTMCSIPQIGYLLSCKYRTKDAFMWKMLAQKVSRRPCRKFNMANMNARLRFEVCTMGSMKVAVFWIVVQYRFTDVSEELADGPDSGGNKRLWNVSKLQRDYTACNQEDRHFDARLLRIAFNDGISSTENSVSCMCLCRHRARPSEWIKEKEFWLFQLYLPFVPPRLSLTETNMFSATVYVEDRYDTSNLKRSSQPIYFFAKNARLVQFREANLSFRSWGLDCSRQSARIKGKGNRIYVKKIPYLWFFCFTATLERRMSKLSVLVSVHEL